LPRLAKFWDALPRATITDGDRVLRLSDGTTFLGLDDRPQELYIRDDYKGLWSLIENNQSMRKVVVTGNPGIGKSYFGLFALHKLSTMGATVVWERTASSERYLFRPGEVAREGGMSSFKQELKQSSTWCDPHVHASSVNSSSTYGAHLSMPSIALHSNLYLLIMQRNPAKSTFANEVVGFGTTTGFLSPNEHKLLLYQSFLLFTQPCVWTKTLPSLPRFACAS
jgi:hypothetical protein